MKAQERLERVLKDLDKLIDIARKAAVGADDLDEKVDMHRCARELEKVRNPIRKEHFRIEDADALAARADNCPVCFSIVSKSTLE